MELNLQLIKGGRELQDCETNCITSKVLLRVPEILEVIFKHLDTERLKICRKVCLTWCNEVARMLRKRVIPKWFNSQWLKFQKVLKSGEGLTRLLCPFQEMHVTNDHRTPMHTSFDWLHPPLPITRLTLLAHESNYNFSNREGSVLAKQILKILQSCSQTLTHLNTTFWGHMEETNLESRLELPQLMELIATGFEDSFHSLGLSPDPDMMGAELRFYVLIISAAPRLSLLNFNYVTTAPELLRLVSLKKMQKLTVFRTADQGLWEALNQIDTDALISLTMNAASSCGSWEYENFFYRFSKTLKLLDVPVGPYTIPTCPAVETLCFEVDWPMSLSSFPSLKQVALNGHTLNPCIKPCLTVSEVNINQFDPVEVSSRKAVLKQLFRLFPSATSWKINYRALEDFCLVVAEMQFRIEKLEIVLSCAGTALLNPCILVRSSIEEAAETDMQTFSKLPLLTDLRELELRQKLRCSCYNYTTEYGENVIRLLPYSMAGVQLSNLLQLRTLRIYAESHELPPDFLSLQNLDIAVELVITSLPISRNWSDSVVYMRNLTISS